MCVWGGGGLSFNWCKPCPVLPCKYHFGKGIELHVLCHNNILIHVHIIRLAWLHIGSNRISDRFVYRTSLIGCQTGLCIMFCTCITKNFRDKKHFSRI